MRTPNVRVVIEGYPETKYCGDSGALVFKVAEPICLIHYTPIIFAAGIKPASGNGWW